MADLLERIHGEIRARLRASEAAVHEYERLEAALAALSGQPLPASSSGATATRARASRGRTAPQASTTRSKRAPRGANRAAALRAIGEHPGAGVADLVAATGISRPVLYALLARLTEHGEIRTQTLPDRATGYVITGAPASVTEAVEPGTPADSPATVGADAPAEQLTGDGPSDLPEAMSTVSTPQPASSMTEPSPGPNSVAVVALRTPASTGPESAEAFAEATSAEPHDDLRIEPLDAPDARPNSSVLRKPAGGSRRPKKRSAPVSDMAAGARGRTKPKAKPAARKASPAKAKPSVPSGSRRSGRSKPKPPASG